MLFKHPNPAKSTRLEQPIQRIENVLLDEDQTSHGEILKKWPRQNFDSSWPEELRTLDSRKRSVKNRQRVEHQSGQFPGISAFQESDEGGTQTGISSLNATTRDVIGPKADGR